MIVESIGHLDFGTFPGVYKQMGNPMQSDDAPRAATTSSHIRAILDAIKETRKVANGQPGGRFATTYADRKNWDSGPWDGEPDRVEFQTWTGLRGLLLRGPSGAWCGYVAVEPGHPCYGRGQLAEYVVERDEKGRRTLGNLTPRTDLSPDPTRGLSVHGGVTYADSGGGRIASSADGDEGRDLWWVGFDCAHVWDFSPALRAWLRELGLGASGSEMETYRTMEYARGEVERLSGQLAEMKPA